jgi:hypothetical protein
MVHSAEEWFGAKSITANTGLASIRLRRIVKNSAHATAA